MHRYDLTALVLVIFAFLILLYKIDKPFWGQFDWTGAWFGTIARNYLQIDIAKTRLAPITVAGTVSREEWEYYNHYPITYPLMVAGSMALFGDHEWAIRIVSAAFSVLVLGAIYLICRRFFHPLAGIFGIVVLLVTPMFIYYGKLPVHEQPVLFFSLMALYFYLASRTGLMLLFMIFAFMISWTGAYMFFLITIHLLLTDRGKWRLLIPGYLAMTVIALTHLAHIQFSSDINDFFQAVATRTSNGGSLLAFLIKQGQWFLALYSKPLALVSIIGLVIFRKPVLLMLFAWGFFQFVVVNQIAWIHDYMLIYFLPFVAFSCGIFFWKIFSANKVAGLIVAGGVISLSLITQWPFTMALLNSKDQTAELYPLAMTIKRYTVYGDRVFVPVPSSDYEIHYPKHYLSYYSDRFITYVESPDLVNIRYEKR